MILALIYLRRFNVDEIIAAAPENMLLAAALLLGLYVIKSLSMVLYLKLLYVASGLLFPLGAALLLNTAGTALVLTIPFFIGRFSGGELADKIRQKHPRIQELNRLQQKNGFLFAFVTRLVGFIPADPLSLYCGASGDRFGPYFLGGMLGMAPALLLVTIAAANGENPASPGFILPVAGYALLVLAAAFLVIRRRKKEKTGKGSR